MSEAVRGKYIVIEGPDGSGKTTQVAKLREAVIAQGIEVVEVTEPGGTAIGDALRAIIKDSTLSRDPLTNLDLFTASRRELAGQKIRPALERGAYVISSRNWFSSIAIQGFCQQLSLGAIVTSSLRALGGLFLPDGACIIDVPVEETERRLAARGTRSADLFGQAGREHFESMRQGYLWIAERYDIPIIDGMGTPEAVHERIMSRLGGLLVANASEVS